jgi:hypothetical protein
MTEQKKMYSGVVHVTRGMPVNAVYAALIEQLFEMQGPKSVARLFAERLRDPEPHPGVLCMVARCLEPQSDNRFELVLKRRRNGKSPTTQINDVAITKAINDRQALGKKRLSKADVGGIAVQLGISDAKVRKVISQIRK